MLDLESRSRSRSSSENFVEKLSSDSMASAFPQDCANIIDEKQNSDTVDGFRRYLRESFAKLSCTGIGFSKKKKERPSDEMTSEELLDSTDNKNKQKQLFLEFDWADQEYNFSHPKRGLAIIINNEDFSRCNYLEDRLASDKDASALYNSFTLLGFDVKQYDNLEAWEMVEVLEAAAKYYNHGASDCFVCAVLTHGIDALAKLEEYSSTEKVHVDLLYGIDGIAVTVKYLVETFNDTYCSTLKDKPRLFFLQACRGKKCDDGQNLLVKKTEPINPFYHGGGDGQDAKEKNMVHLQEESFSSNDEPLQNHALDKRDTLEDLDEDEDDTNISDSEGNPEQPAASNDKTAALWIPLKNPLPHPAPLYKDFLIMYAAPPGHTAWRNEEDGSWFIQTLCKVLNGTDLTSISLLRALTKVSGLIARDFESRNDEYPQKKGLPVIESKLLKDIFIPKKTRKTAADICF